MAIKNCSKCSSLFECSCETYGCWCENMFVDIKTLAEIKNQFDNCLCPACLNKYTIKQEKK